MPSSSIWRRSAVNEAEETIRQLLPHAEPFVVNRDPRLFGGQPAVHRRVVSFGRPREHGASQPGVRTAARRGSKADRIAPSSGYLRHKRSWFARRPSSAMSSRCRSSNASPAAASTTLLFGSCRAGSDFPGRTQGTLRFKHGIARDMIYKAVGLHQRNAMHMQIAETLRQHGPSGGEEEPYELLAYHYGASGKAAEAARYAELAGDKAMAASALDRAQISTAPPWPRSTSGKRTAATSAGSIAQRLAQCCVFDPSREQLGILQQAVELATTHGDQNAMARAEYWVGYVTYALG